MEKAPTYSPGPAATRAGGTERVLAVLCLLWLSVTAGAAQDPAGPPLRSGCEVGYPPFCIVHADGRADGFSVELLRAALDKMMREVSFRTGTWPEVNGWLKSGEIDCLPLVGRTPEREPFFDFTVPYLTMHGAIVVRRDTAGIHTLADLRGRTVGVMQGDNAEEFLRRKDRGLEILTTPTFPDALRVLAAGGCDAVFIQRLVAMRLLAETDLSGRLRLIEQPVLEFAQDFCFAVQEGDRATLALLNEGLALCMSDGTYRRLHAKWFAHLELPPDRPIVIGGDHRYPPFEFLDERGRPAGFTVELTRAIAREMGIDVQIRLAPWEDTVASLRDGRIDAIQGMFYSSERNRLFDFSPHYLVLHCVSAVRRGTGPPPTAIEELTGRDLVVQTADAILDELAERGIKARIHTVATQADVIRAVAEGRHDCGLATRYGALYAIGKHGWTNIALGDRSFYSGQYGYAVPKGHDALLAQLTEGLRQLKDSGEYRRLHEKWMGVYEDHFVWSDLLRIVALVAGPLILIALLALLWTWILGRQVAAKTRELREQQAFFRNVLDNLPVGVAVNPLDEDAPLEYMNDLFPRFYRTTRAALSSVGTFWREVYQDPAFREQIRARVEADCASGNPERMYWPDVPIVRAGEATRYIAARNTPVPGSNRMISIVWDVTERKAQEAAIRASEQRYRLLADNTLDVIWMMSLELEFTYVNPAIERLTGYTPREWVGSRLSDHCDQAHCARLAEIIRQELARGPEKQGLVFETEILRKDGAAIAVEIHSRAVFDKTGAPLHLQGVARDIGDRKRHEAHVVHLNRVLRAIRDVNQLITHEDNREALLQRACETLISTRGYLSAWVALRGPDGRPAALAQSGIGDEFAALRHDLERDIWPACCRRAMQSPDGIAAMLDLAANCPACPLSRKHHDTAALAGALRHGDCEFGALVVALPAGLADDPDEQSLFRELVGDVAYALHALETAQRRREEETRFRSYVEHAPYGVFIADRAGRYVDVNPAASAITGYSREELLAMSIPDSLAPEDREMGARHFQTVLESGRSEGELYSVRKDGARRRWHVLAVTLSRERFLGFVQDVTERESLESQLRQAQKMESVGRLAGGVAHDFNNLLMGIMGYAEMCREAVGGDHPIREWLDEITHEVERSADLTRQLLAFARRQTIAPKVLDLNDAVANMLKMLRRLIGEDIDLAWEPGADLWPVKIDPGQVDQLLANLCVNARDAIGGAGKVTIETENTAIDEAYCAQQVEARPGQYVILAVSDNGCGMDRETLDHVFEPFFTTKGIGKGTGLGLATVYGIVKQNEGFINVYSEVGKGATFRIYLPRVMGEAAGKPRAAPAESSPGGTETILLVEDEPSLRVTISRSLQRLGYTVLAAESPEAARDIAAGAAGGIDLLLTDVVMPGMSGRELAERLTRDFPAMKVLYMSGYTANVIAHRGILEQGVHFLSKPVTRDELARKLREILDGG